MRTEQSISNRYTVTAGVLAYSVTFPLYEAGDVTVFLSTDGGDTERQLSLGSDYSVAINSNMMGGTVTLKAGVASPGNLLAFLSSVPYTQELDLTGVSTIDVQATETQLDRMEQQIQQLKELSDRHLKVTATGDKTPDQAMKDILDVAEHAGEYAQLADRAYQEASSVRDDVQAMYNGLAPIVPVLDDVVALAPVAGSIPVTAANANSIRIVADDLQGLPLMSLDLGYVRDPAEPINDANGSILAQLVENADAIADIADHLDELLGIVSTAQAAAAEARQSASSAMASEARIQSLEDETRELIATNYAEVLQNGN